MVNHKKLYCSFFNLDVDIHHIDARGMGGSHKDYIENLVALCRKCHDKAESSRSFNKHVRVKHLQKVIMKLQD